MNSAVGGREAKQLVPDEADEDQAGTNRLELCFALLTHISPVRHWDKLLLRKLNPRQTATLDHYKLHPQIFVAICNFEDYKTFLLLPTAEIGVVFFVCFTTYTLRISFFSCRYTLFLSDVVIGPSFKESQRGAGQCMVTFLEWAFDLLFHAVAERLEGGGQGCGRKGYNNWYRLNQVVTLRGYI